MVKLFKILLTLILIISFIWLFLPWASYGGVEISGFDVVRGSAGIIASGYFKQLATELIILTAVPIGLMFIAGIISAGKPGVVKMLICAVFCGSALFCLIFWRDKLLRSDAASGIGLNLAIITAIVGIVLSILVLILYSVSKKPETTVE